MKKIKEFTVGIICGALLISTMPVVAKVGKQSIDVVFNNIKLDAMGQLLQCLVM